MAEMTEKELLNLKEKIDKAKGKVSELTGKQKYLKEELLKWECKDIEEAEKKLKNMNLKITKLTKEINERVEEIRNLYNL